MYNISDIFFNPNIPFRVKQAVLEFMDRKNIFEDVQVLVPSATNDDVNGSQHATNGGTDFTYEDATDETVAAGSTLGYYEYFASYGYRTYTGHYYQGSDAKFAAIVIDPPAYAVSGYLR